MKVGYTYKCRVNSGFLKGPWRSLEGSIFSYNPSQSVKTTCKNEEFSKFLVRIENAILKNEPNEYKDFCIGIERRVIDATNGDPYRVFDTNIMTKRSSLGSWKWLAGGSFIFSQSDTNGDEDLNLNPDFNEFFKELRSRFQRNTFPRRSGGQHDEIALFLETNFSAR